MLLDLEVPILICRVSLLSIKTMNWICDNTRSGGVRLITSNVVVRGSYRNRMVHKNGPYSSDSCKDMVEWFVQVHKAHVDRLDKRPQVSSRIKNWSSDGRVVPLVTKFASSTEDMSVGLSRSSKAASHHQTVSLVEVSRTPPPLYTILVELCFPSSDGLLAVDMVE